MRAKAIKLGNKASFWGNEIMPLGKILKIKGNKVQISHQGWGYIDEIKRIEHPEFLNPEVPA